jgi:ferredoxin-NADP reductase
MMASATIPVRVAEVDRITPLVKRLALQPSDGVSLPAFSGGSHVVVTMQRGEGVHRNPYSLIGPPGDRSRYQIAVLRVERSRGGSVFLHDHAGIGTALQITPPVNLFPLIGQARKHVLVAGGIGITPFLAHLDELRRMGARYELHYAARDLEHAAFADRLLAEDPGRVRLYPSRQGRRIEPAALLAHQPLGTHVYVCGPGPMIEAVVAAARAAGWPPSHVHWERFAAPGPGRPFTAVLARSRRSVLVRGDVSLLEALEADGLQPPYLCRGGACGACETAVLAGEVEHGDHYLSDEVKAAHTRIMPCVSRARGDRIVLDI